MSKPFCASGSAPAAGSGARRPYLIGIAGNRGSGKSKVGKRLSDLGAQVFDLDKITHELLDNPGAAYTEVLARFGQDLAPAPGAPIDRATLAQRAFQNSDTKAALEAILHPRINERLEEKISAASAEKVLGIEASQLFEAGLQDYFDEIWLVVADFEIRVHRVVDRDGVGEDEARHLISLQMPQEEKVKLVKPNLIIDNSGTLEDTYAKVDALYLGALARADARDSAAANDGANERYREVFRQLGLLGVAEAVARLGDVGTTGHKAARADLTMDVDSNNPDQRRRLKVAVDMDIRNDPPGPCDGGCSCGCGSNCRVSCACQPDCGCGCKKPIPPVPPDPDHGGNCNKRGSRWLAVVLLLGLFGLLGFFGFLVWEHYQHQPPVVIVNTVPSCPDSCQPKTPDNPPVVTPPYVPPAPVVVSPTCPTGTQEVDEIPGFAFRFVQNAVRVQVTRWVVSYPGNCAGATVTGYNAAGQRLVYQEYDSDLWMTWQWVFKYFPNGDVQVDRYAGRENIFTGRTTYRYQAGGLVRVEQCDGYQRPLVTAVIERGGAALTVIEFDRASGSPTRNYAVTGVDSVLQFMQRTFFAFNWVTNP